MPNRLGRSLWPVLQCRSLAAFQVSTEAMGTQVDPQQSPASPQGPPFAMKPPPASHPGPQIPPAQVSPGAQVAPSFPLDQPVRLTNVPSEGPQASHGSWGLVSPAQYVVPLMLHPCAHVPPSHTNPAQQLELEHTCPGWLQPPPVLLDDEFPLLEVDEGLPLDEVVEVDEAEVREFSVLELGPPPEALEPEGPPTLPVAVAAPEVGEEPPAVDPFVVECATRCSPTTRRCRSLRRGRRWKPRCPTPRWSWTNAPSPKTRSMPRCSPCARSHSPGGGSNRPERPLERCPKRGSHRGGSAWRVLGADERRREVAHLHRIQHGRHGALAARRTARPANVSILGRAACHPEVCLPWRGRVARRLLAYGERAASLLVPAGSGVPSTSWRRRRLPSTGGSVPRSRRARISPSLPSRPPAEGRFGRRCRASRGWSAARRG
jgi:hypothetical protein